jgi:hypothetical protein
LIAGDFHVLSSLPYNELSSNMIISNWVALQGYYMVKCDSQSSDMVKIGFLTGVCPFDWREDFRNEIKDMALWQSSPLQFRLFPGSLSCNKKCIMAPVMMVELERDEVSSGLEFFCHAFTGDNPLSSCGLSYLFFTPYQNQLMDSECFNIIQDAIHHIGEVELLHLHGFQEIDTLVTLKQGINVQLQKLLLGLRAHQTNSGLFVQIEREASLESLICAFNSINRESVMSNLPHLYLLIRNCILEEDYDKVFLYEDYSITTLTKSIPIKVGKMQVSSKPIPLEVQEHTTLALSKKQTSSPCPSVTTQSALSTTSTTTTPPSVTHPVPNLYPNSNWARNSMMTMEARFNMIEQRLSSSEPYRSTLCSSKE